MGEAIGPGDWVECVVPSRERDILVPGRIYRVAKVTPGPWPNCDFGVHLVEPRNPNPAGWCDYLFRPIYRPKAELIETLKAPPQRVPEHA